MGFSRRVWLAIAAAAACALPAPVSALTYSSSCERFEIDGSAFGPADGTLDFVDEFDNGALGPQWIALLGSAAETGGAAVMHNPGFNVQLGPTPFEITTIENKVHGIGDGEGNFTGKSFWTPTLPPSDSELHMQLYSVAPIIEAAGLTVNNFSAAVAAQQGNGTLAGYSIGASVTQGFGPSFVVVESHSVPFDPASVTGRIVLRLSLDDATNMLTCSFSLNGGTTFHSPFPPMHIFNRGVNDYDILLGAAGLGTVGPPPPLPPPPLATMPLQVFQVQDPGTPTKRKVTYTVSQRGAAGPPNFGNPAALGATLKVAVDGSQQCFHLPPGSFWTTRSGGTSYAYKDKAGVNGPVQQASIKMSSNGTLQSKVVILGKLGAVSLFPPNPGTRGDVRLHLPNGGDYCGSTVGGSIRKNDARTFQVTKSPAPAVCGISTCSPSGAFLDEADVLE